MNFSAKYKDYKEQNGCKPDNGTEPDYPESVVVMILKPDVQTSDHNDDE